METSADKNVRGTVFNIQFFNLHDGPGTRTLVFFKGCPLRCKWCSNPESMSGLLELGLQRTVCDECGKCIDACPEQALFFSDDKTINVSRQKCTACGECVAACAPEALTIYGKEMTAAEVFEEVYKDKMFYEGTGGGVTISGGEPMQQPDFLAAVFGLCREAGIHTCVETTGYTGEKVLERILPLTDYVLFDLKHLDSRVHRALTGKSNEQILENASRVAASDIPMMFRMPLVPGFNDNQDNIEAIANFVKHLEGGNIQGIELMPYHRMGIGKYESLDRAYELDEVEPFEPEGVESVRQRFEGLGVKCTISK